MEDMNSNFMSQINKLTEDLEAARHGASNTFLPSFVIINALNLWPLILAENEELVAARDASMFEQIDAFQFGKFGEHGDHSVCDIYLACRPVKSNLLWEYAAYVPTYVY